MKVMNLIASTVFAVLVLSVGAALAQDKKAEMKPMKAGMQMSGKDPHHMIGMGYKQNALTFAQALRDMSAGAKIEDVILARAAFDEVKRSLGKMDELRQSHMGKMAPDMIAKMKPMMEKMQAGMAATREHVTALETALGSDTPSAQDVHTHAAELASQLEKMGMEGKGKM